VVAALRTVPWGVAIWKPVKLTVVARLPRYMLLANCIGSLVLTKNLGSHAVVVVVDIARAACCFFALQAYTVCSSFDKCPFEMASDSSTSPACDLANTTTFDDESCQDDCTSEHTENLAAENDPWETYDELCDLCGSLNIESLVSDHGSGGKIYDLDVLIDAASRCKTCERLFDLKELRKIDGAYCNNGIQVRFGTSPRVGGWCGILRVQAVDFPQPLSDCMSGKLLAEYTVFTNEGDIASSKHGLLALQPMGINTSSAESLETARTWLHHCIGGHQEIEKPCATSSRGYQNLNHFRAISFRNRFNELPSDTGVGPTRLIDVFAHEQDARSTACVENGPEESSALESSDQIGDACLAGQRGLCRVVDRVDVLGPYLALSYRWGSRPPQDHVTTNANFLARKWNLAQDELPKTFQHAIHITRRLGVRYLWIDAICIIQDTEFEDDWLEESSKMGSIFANAQLTLVAAAAKNGEEGMYNKRSTYGAEKRRGYDRHTLHTGLPGSSVRRKLHFVPYGHVSSRLGFRPHRADGPLLSRAWCLQEDLLATRKLYYASDQLYWECDHLALSQDGCAHPELSPSFPASPLISNLKESELAWHASFSWYKDVIGRHYSQRVATKVTDRLIAVSGLARRAANTIKSRYLAGLWELSILQGLLWQTRTIIKDGIPTHCGAPSWSWASQEVATEWMSMGHENFVPGCEYLGAHIDLLGSDEYGGVTSGTLTLRSNVVAVVLVEEAMYGRHEKFSASCEGVRGWAHLDEKISLSHTRVLAVPVLDDVLLLVTQNPGSHTYRRVGLWRISSNVKYPSWWPALDTWDRPAEYLRWRDQILPTTPVTEITIV
jgi:hypothetical protein